MYIAPNYDSLRPSENECGLLWLRLLEQPQRIIAQCSDSTLGHS